MPEQITKAATLRQIVVEHPETRPVLERYELDYCCGGARPLGEAADEAGVKVDELLKALEEAVAAEKEEPSDHVNWSEGTLTELADYIESTHHPFMKRQLPRVSELFEKVISAHEEVHGPMLGRMQQVFGALREEIEMHLQKEEQVLFPYIRQMEDYAEGSGPRPIIHCITVRNPVQQMELEHDHAGHALEEMREASDDYRLPEDACEAFRALYDALQELEADLHEHIHLENNILFPRAVALEQNTLTDAPQSI
ncbi:MAG: iron-sulfur cluster repair di-iron protein [Candidatus Brocadiia bacterium]